MKLNWKSGFICLLVVNILIIISLLIYILIPVKVEEPIQNPEVVNGIDFKIETNKKDVTTLINNYLEKEAMTEPISYKVILSEKVMLIGTITVFKKEIDLVMTFNPVVQENGDLLLEQESIALGQLQLPVSFILKYISDNYSLPTWISIDPKDQVIYAALTQMKLKSDIHVKVNQFDLANDSIVLNIRVPLEE